MLALVIRFMLIVSLLLLIYDLLLAALLVQWLWLAIVAAILIILFRKPSQLHAFGTARWAEVRDLIGMVNGGSGVLIGKIQDTTSPLSTAAGLFDRTVPSRLASARFLDSIQRHKPDKMVRLNLSCHVAAFAPTGVGKGVSIVLPHLFSCPDSMVVVDFKGELALATAEARRRMGHRIVLLDPWQIVTKNPDTYNPLMFDKNSANALDDCRSLATEIVIRTQEKGDGIHFIDNAESAIASISGMVLQYGDDTSTSLQTVCECVSDPESWTKSIETMKASPHWDGLLARMGGSLEHLRDRELASTMTTTNRFLRFLSTPAVAASTMSSTFDPADLPKQNMTVYLVIPPNRLSANTALLRLWIGSMLRAIVNGGLQEKRKVHFVLDEAASLGPMDAINDAVDKYRAFGIRLLFLYQSIAQLKKCFPDGQDQTLLSNVTQIFFGVNDNETAKFVSERLGKETNLLDSGGSSHSFSHQSSPEGKGSSSNSTTKNYNWQQSGRELLLPSEVMSMSPIHAITFAPGGIPPICTTLVRWYDPEFKKLLTHRRPNFKDFIDAVCCLLITGVFAVGLTLLVQKNLVNQQNFYADERP